MAATVGKGIVEADIVDTHVVFGALVGAIYVEPYHLVLRHPIQLLARLDTVGWWARAWPRAVSAP